MLFSKGCQTLLHSWNNFEAGEKERKLPVFRQFSKKEIVVSDKFVVNDTGCSNIEPLIDYDLEIKCLEDEINRIKETQANERNKFVDHVLSIDKMLKHYTGFPNRKTFDAIYIFLDPGEKGGNITLSETRGRKCILLRLEACLLTLVRLRNLHKSFYISFFCI